MGQAKVDLPEPLNKPALGAAPSTDDLLAQMAGQEIDRLLAEASVERPATPPAQPQSAAPSAPAAAPVAAQSAEASLENQLDALFQELNASPEAAADKKTVAAQPPAVEPLVPTTAAPAEMAAADAAIAAAVSAVIAPPDAASPAATSPAPAAHADADSPDLAEREALTAPLMDVMAVQAELEELTADDPPSLPFYLRPLGWLSAPLDGCSDHVRSLVGKIAIITLVNAVVILGYVLLFRRG